MRPRSSLLVVLALLALPILIPAAAPLQAASAIPASTTSVPAYDDRSDPVRLLASYYNAINRRAQCVCQPAHAAGCDARGWQPTHLCRLLCCAAKQCASHGMASL